MIAAEAALGRHPFGEATDEAVSIHLVNRRPVPLDGVADDRVKLLCQGLLCYEQKHRWGMAHVREWLAGGNPPIIQDIDEIKKLKYAPFRIGGRDCWTLPELAAGLVANWDESGQTDRAAYRYRALAVAGPEGPGHLQPLSGPVRKHSIPAT